MKLESINLKEYYLREIFPYIMMSLTIIFYGFPFKFPHNTFNLIQKYDLPGYAYAVFTVLFLVSFFVMIISFFSDPKTTKADVELEKESLKYKGRCLSFNNLVHFRIKGKYKITIKDKIVWKFTANFGKEEIVAYLLLSFKEKKDIENFLFNVLESNSSKKLLK